MRTGDSKRAGFSVELMVSNLQETVYKLIGAVQSEPFDEYMIPPAA
jgi:hypothetical protein